MIDKLGPIAQAVVSALIIAAFMATIGALFYVKADFGQGVREVLLVLVGVLAGAFKDVVGFWLGTSLSSAKKDALLAKQGGGEM